MTDLIARIYPYGEFAKNAICSAENRSRFVDAPPDQLSSPDRRSRETTASLDDIEEGSTNDDEETRKLENQPYLQWTFSQGPKGSKGLMFGHCPNSDIVLPRLNYISREHCYLTFDAQYRLILRDKSTYGTAVKYGKEEATKKRNFTWIVGGHEALDRYKVIVIHFNKLLKFQIVVVEHDISSHIYQANVNHFLHEIEENLLIGGLGLTSPKRTAPASQFQTPGIQTPTLKNEPAKPNENSVLLKQRILGKGAFAVVTCDWDVSTGIYYAAKAFFNPEKVDWRGEVLRMEKLSHVSYPTNSLSIDNPNLIRTISSSFLQRF